MTTELPEPPKVPLPDSVKSLDIMPISSLIMPPLKRISGKRVTETPDFILAIPPPDADMTPDTLICVPFSKLTVAVELTSSLPAPLIIVPVIS